MKKRIISFLLVLCMVAAMLPLSAMAAGKGTLDDPWISNGVKVYRDGTTLYVFGSGDMADYASNTAPEWYGVAGNIQRIVIEAAVESLGANAFSACGSVSTVVLKRDLSAYPDLTLDIAKTALPAGISVELEVSGSGYMKEGNSEQTWANLKNDLTKVTIRDGVRSVGSQAFSGCTKLQSVVIPGSVEFIGAQAFANCVNLKDVVLVHDFGYNALSGKAFTIGNGAFPVENAGFNIALEIAGSTAIPDYATADAQPWANYRPYITQLTIEGNVPRIGNNAFHSCDQLKSISFYFNENGAYAQKVFGKDTFKYTANKTLNVVAVSENLAFKGWGGATFANATVANTVLYYNAEGMTVYADWYPIARGIELNPKTDKAYGDIELGYAEQPVYGVTVKNTGNTDSGTLYVELSGGYPIAFNLSTKVISSLSPKGTATFTVAPVIGMPIGDYFTNVIVSDDDGTIAKFTVSYSVGTPASRAARYVRRLYTCALGRAEDKITDEEINGYVTGLLNKTFTAASVAAAFYGSDEFRARGLTDAAFVTSLYRALLGRNPGAAELADWVNTIAAGKTRTEVLSTFITSAEFKAIAAATPMELGTIDSKLDISNKVAASTQAVAFVTRLYQCVLDREPEEAGLNDWAGKLTNGKLSAAQVAAGFFGSQEYRNRKTTNYDFLFDLYYTMFDRSPDSSGFQYWMDNMAAGMNRVAVFNGFTMSTEFNTLCNLYGYEAGSVDVSGYNMGENSNAGTQIAKMSNMAADYAVTDLYKIILNREPDAAGLADNRKALTDGTATHATVAAGLAGSQEFINRNLSDEMFIATIFRALLARDPNPAETASWKGTLTGGATRSTVFAMIAASDEYKLRCNDYGYSWSSIDPSKYVMQAPAAKNIYTKELATSVITSIYNGALNRNPVGTEADGWINDLMYGNKTAAQIAAAIFSGAEYHARGRSNEQFVNDAYLTLFGRNADAAGLAQWTQTITDGATRSQVFAELLKSNEYINRCAGAGIAAGTIDSNAFSM